MKIGKTKRMRASAFILAAALAVGVYATQTQVRAQGHAGHTMGQTQTGDMPYDLHFIDMMIMHHEQGIEMARLAGERGQSTRVKALAARIVADQQKDSGELRGHREHWYAGRPQMDHSQMMGHMGQMMPGHGNMKMDPEQDMAKLRAAEGRAFDRLFLDTMTMHHRMAIDMSKDAQRKAEHAEIKSFARKTATKQQGEIAEINRIKAGLGGVTKRVTKAARKTSTTRKSDGHTHKH